MVRFAKINDLITDKISGEWGEEVNGEPGVNVLRTTNFTNQGSLNLQSVVKRKISADLIAKKKLSKGDVIIEKSGGSPTQPVGRVVYFDLEGEDYLCNNFTAVLRPSKEIFPKYFFYALYFLHLSKRTLKYQNKTTGILNLKLERYLEEEQIKIPDLPTQKQIAQFLEEADIARQKRKTANALTDQFLQSTFLSMFGDPMQNDKAWKACTVIDECDCIVPGRDKPKSFTGSIPWITTDDLDNGFTTFKSKKGLALSYDEIKFVRAKIIPTGSVLLTCVGDLGVISIAGEQMVINQQLHSFQCGANLNNIFLAHTLKFMKGYMYKMASSTTVPYMNKTICNSIPIILPSISLQQKFASIVADTEQLRHKQKQSEIELENLFQALLQKYFG